MIRADGTRIYADVAYAELHGFRPLLLDLYVPVAGVVRPDSPTDLPPLAIWIHGGGFHSGDRRNLPETYPPNSVFDRLVAAGVAVATVDYRLSAEATFPAQIDDVHAAIDYLRRFAPAYGIDADRIGTWGESAGGALAALAGLTSGQVSAVVAWYPLTDLAHHHPDRSDSVEAELLGAAPETVPELAASASAVTRVTADAPPFLIVHGDADGVLPLDQSERLHAALVAVGASSTLHVVPGADHCFEGYGDIGGLLDESVAFLSSTLSAATLSPSPASASELPASASASSVGVGDTR
ncbi:MAG TPA: alpha/beta hydrolase [Micromonosporaceae bacterium]|nr:alpha/beta hydrolase [Micromonosporaceae bacterium]